MHHWIQLLIQQVVETSLLQWIAVALGVAEVLLARNNNVWLYPTGILGILLGGYLLFQAQLYAETALNIYYLVMSVYGWILWVKRPGHEGLEVSYSNRTEWTISLAITFGGWAVLYFLLKNFTPSNVPLWDAWVSSTAWAGMWLLARRKMENWLFLNISNLFAIPLLFYKNLPLFAGLTIFLFIVAFSGFFEWQKIYKREKLSVI